MIYDHVIRIFWEVDHVRENGSAGRGTKLVWHYVCRLSRYIKNSLRNNGNNDQRSWKALQRKRLAESGITEARKTSKNHSIHGLISTFRTKQAIVWYSIIIFLLKNTN